MVAALRIAFSPSIHLSMSRADRRCPTRIHVLRLGDHTQEHPAQRLIPSRVGVESVAQAVSYSVFGRARHVIFLFFTVFLDVQAVFYL